MNFFKKIGSFFKGAAIVVADFFVKIFGADAAHKFADGAFTLLKTAAGVLVADAVQFVEAANPLATPADKRTAAIDKIKVDAKAQGLELSSSLINLLIELAVQFFVKGAAKLQ